MGKSILGNLWWGTIREWTDLGKSVLGNLWLGTIREWTDLGTSVLGLSLIGDNPEMDWFGKISSRVTSGNNQRMDWFGKINSGESLNVGQSGNELIWENQFWGYLWLGTIREWNDLGKSVLGLSLTGDNQGMNWFGKISFGVISDWGQSGNELIWENQFWGYLWLGTIREGIDLGKSIPGILLSLGTIRERVDLGKSTQWGNYLIAKKKKIWGIDLRTIRHLELLWNQFKWVRYLVIGDNHESWLVIIRYWELICCVFVYFT